MIIDEFEKLLQNYDGKDFMTLAKEAIGQEPLEVYFKTLSPNAVVPTYAHDGDVGMDLTAISMEYDAENDTYIYHTGLAFETDKHYGIFLFPRSSNRKTDCYLANHVGIADSAIYRGEIMLCYKNRMPLMERAEIARARQFFNAIQRRPFTIVNDNTLQYTWPDAVEAANVEFNWILSNPMNFAPYRVGDRVAQMVVLPYPNVKLLERKELSETERGDGGFGSTGN